MIIEASDNSGYKLEIAEGIASLLNPDQEMLCEFMIEEPENENKWIREWFERLERFENYCMAAITGAVQRGESMIFINSPFEILDEAFRSLYPDKKYRACIEEEVKDDEGNEAFGFTQFIKGETPVIAISAELSIRNATEIFAHELAHVAAGEGAGHGEEWEMEFQRIFDEYNRIGRERFGGEENNGEENE